MSEFLSNEPEAEKYEDMPTDDPTKESRFRIIGPSPDIEDPEKRKQPGEIVESVPFGDMHITRGTICYDDEGLLCEVIDYEYIKDEESYQDDDESVRKPKIFKKPKFTIRYPDGTEKQVMRGITPAYTGRVPQITESEKYYDRSHFEEKGHSFRLGDLVSFGNGIGRLAIIEKEKSEVGIIAPKERGKGGPTFLWIVSIEEIDYIVYDEKGAIKRNPDNTVFKPSL